VVDLHDVPAVKPYEPVPEAQKLGILLLVEFSPNLLRWTPQPPD